MSCMCENYFHLDNFLIIEFIPKSLLKDPDDCLHHGVYIKSTLFIPDMIKTNFVHSNLTILRKLLLT